MTKFFDLEGFKVSTEKRNDGKVSAEASVRLKINGKEEFSAAQGKISGADAMTQSAGNLANNVQSSARGLQTQGLSDAANRFYQSKK